ncbi:MAG: cupin domain-containing protein [Burkholderiales bacterium]
MSRNVTIVSAAEIVAEEQNLGREGQIITKTFPLDTGVAGVDMDYAWISYSKGYGTPRHKHTFDQFRYTLSGVRQQDDLDMREGECGYFGEGVAYGPQLQNEPCVGLLLQFQGPSGIPYLTHAALDAARKRLTAEGGTFAKGVYTKIKPDGTKINVDSHAACFESITGKKIQFPKARYDRPVVMKPQFYRWVPDRRYPGIEHKHLGTFGEYRSSVRLTRLLPGAKVPAHCREDAEVRYLVEGSIGYGGKTWHGGKTQDQGTYMYIPHGAQMEAMSSEAGGMFFVIELPMLADIEAQRSGRLEAQAA